MAEGELFAAMCFSSLSVKGMGLVCSGEPGRVGGRGMNDKYMVC